MSGWRRVLALVLVVLAGLAGTRVDLCLCMDMAPLPAQASAATGTLALAEAPCCCAPAPTALPEDDACGCCAPASEPLASLPRGADHLGAPACDCPALDLSASTPEPAGAPCAVQGDDGRAHPLPHVDLALQREQAPRVAALAARAGPTTRPPPGPLRPHLALHILRC